VDKNSFLFRGLLINK